MQTSTATRLPVTCQTDKGMLGATPLHSELLRGRQPS